jgi:hypothetical protein
MTVRGEKLGGGPVDQSAAVLGIVMRALFLGSHRVCSILLGQHKRLPHTACHERVRVVCIKFLLNRNDSRIQVIACLVVIDT